ncbi:MAG TPA: transglycosylase SLT domain-containing protein [Bacteroidia bacterium]|nr:transglycosylase SLT domain-containing protein [Bacteroidia bacterium]
MMNLLVSARSFYRRWFRHLLVLPSLFFIVIIAELFNFSFSDPVTDADYRNNFLNSYKVFGVTIPMDLNFCGEPVPLSDFSVREALERELLISTYFKSHSLMLHKRASRWFPLIEPILKKHNIPNDFKFVALVESGLMNVVSPRNAAGFWQLIPPTAENYGLEINDEIDERFHVEKATEAACRFLNEAYKKYGNWTMVAASYNLGMGGIDRQMAKQKSANYYDLYLTEETARYVFRIIAVKEIISRPKAYGYKLRPRDLYAPIPVYPVKVDSSVTDLTAFALSQGSTFKILKLMNPWLLRSSLSNPTRKTYFLHFPKKGVRLYGLEEDDDDSVITLLPDTNQLITAVINPSDTALKIHMVTAGETWQSIALNYNLEVIKLLAWNKHVDGDQPVPGEEIIIPR